MAQPVSLDRERFIAMAQALLVVVHIAHLTWDGHTVVGMSQQAHVWSEAAPAPAPAALAG